MDDLAEILAKFLDGEDENADAGNTNDQRSEQGSSDWEDIESDEDDSDEDDSEEDESMKDESMKDGSGEDSDGNNDDRADEGNDGDAQSPKYCPICLKVAKLSTCQGCNDMAYCSGSCQRSDWPVHKHLCRQLSTFQATTRPEHHFRAILFPANDASTPEWLVGAKAPSPKFIWFGKPWQSEPFFPPDGLTEGHDYRTALMGRRQRVSTQRLRIMHPAYMMGLPRNCCIEAVVGNRYLMRPWPELGWRGNILVVGYKGDVTMRDFRAVVDFFQCYPQNRALVDPSRYRGRTFAGVLALPDVHILEPMVEPAVLEVRLTEGMDIWMHRVSLKLLDKLLPVYALLEKAGRDEENLDTSTKNSINLNEGSLLLMISTSIDLLGKVILPLDPLPSGPVIYFREDEKPLLKHHYDALTEFVCSKAIEAAGAEGLPEMMVAALGHYKAKKRELKRLLTKDAFRAFWNSYCEKNGLEATPCPLDL